MDIENIIMAVIAGSLAIIMACVAVGAVVVTVRFVLGG